MTTLYKPVLIESAEQAEALPEGSVATHPEYLPIELSHDGNEGVFGYGGGRDAIYAEHLIGWTALVPIEAEVETEEVARHPLAVELGWPDTPARIHTARWVERG